MLQSPIAERILSGEHLVLVTIDEDCSRLQVLKHNLSNLGRHAGIRCNVSPLPTTRGDEGIIHIEHVELPNRQRVITILENSPLLITVKQDDQLHPNNTHP
ncbi:MAG: hypothetical protein AAB365_01445 [Patescibacteria group bacterium]